MGKSTHFGVSQGPFKLTWIYRGPTCLARTLPLQGPHDTNPLPPPPPPPAPPAPQSHPRPPSLQLPSGSLWASPTHTASPWTTAQRAGPTWSSPWRRHSMTSLSPHPKWQLHPSAMAAKFSVLSFIKR